MEDTGIMVVIIIMVLMFGVAIGGGLKQSITKTSINEFKECLEITHGTDRDWCIDKFLK